MLQKNKLTKTIILFSIFFLIIICVIIFRVTKKTVTTSYNTKRTFGQFSVENFSIKSFRDGKPFFMSKAEKIIQRERTAGLFRYYNLKELYISHLILEFYPGESNSLYEKSIPNIVKTTIAENIGGMFIKKDDNVQIADNSDYIDINTLMDKPDYKIITRAVIDNFLIVLHLLDNSSVKVSSDNAVINLESRNIEFKKNFSIVDAQNRKLTAPEAVWTYKSNLIFLPRGYILFPFKHGQGASFSIDVSGKLKKSRKPVKTELKKDRIDEMERILMAKFITPYLNTFYISLLTKGKFNF